MKKKQSLNAADVAAFMGVSVPTAYKIIRRLNDELSARGFITIAGKVSRSYFERRRYIAVCRRHLTPPNRLKMGGAIWVHRPFPEEPSRG